MYRAVEGSFKLHEAKQKYVGKDLSGEANFKIDKVEGLTQDQEDIDR
jgi:hypothetical protein